MKNKEYQDLQDKVISDIDLLCRQKHIEGIKYGIGRLETVQVWLESKTPKKHILLWIDNMIKEEKKRIEEYVEQ